jgi:hypothetical protein
MPSNGRSLEEEDIWRRVQAMKLVIFSPASCYFMPLGDIYF